MNGRVYDPLLGRILSPDPFLQDPTNTQNFNRYSYCFNNPLKYTDPSGYLSTTNSSFWDYFDFLWNMGTNGSQEARSNGGHVQGYTISSSDNGGSGGGGDDDLAAIANISPIVIVGGKVDQGTLAQSWREINDILNGYENHQYLNRNGIYGLISSENNQIDYRHQGGGTSSSTDNFAYIDISKQPKYFVGYPPLVGNLGSIPQAARALYSLAIAGTIVESYDRAKLLIKYANERARLLEKTSETPGFQYAIRAVIPGDYPNVRGGTTPLKVGDVWKFGTTTKGFARYGTNEIPPSLKMIPEFYGNAITILLLEKSKIYSYLMLNFKLPPGNKILR